MDGQEATGEAWSATLAAARGWLARLGERGDRKQIGEAFQAWIAEAPDNERAFVAVCMEYLKATPDPPPAPEGR